MKICVLAQRVPYPPNKGEKLRTFHQIKRLVELGHTVSVLSFHETAQDEEYAKALATALDINVDTVSLGGRPQRYLWALLNQQPISVGAFYAADMQRRVNAIVQEQQTDALLLSASSLAFYVKQALGGQPAGAPCRLLIDMMDVDSDKWRQYAQSASWPMTWVYQREARGIRQLEQYANQTFDHSFLIAREEVKLFAEQVSSARPVTVLGNGLAFDEFYPPQTTPDGQPAHFLFTGVMDYKPNVDAVMWFVKECWPTIKQALPEATFTIGGMNPSADVQALASQPGIEVTGFVDDMLPYFHAATAFVAPFRLARGVQNKVLQAAACGIPIVTTPMGAEGIGFAGDHTMAIASEAEAFARACIATTHEREAALARADNAHHELNQTYSWEQQLQPLEEALAHV